MIDYRGDTNCRHVHVYKIDLIVYSMYKVQSAEK